MMCVKYPKDLLYGSVAHNIRKMKRVKYLQDRRPFRIHVKLNIVKNFFTIRDARVKYFKDLLYDVRKDNDFSLSTYSLRTMVSVRKGVL